MPRSPAAISPEAEAIFAAMEPFDSPYVLDQPLDGIRKAQREGYTPAVEMALARYPVTIAEVEVGGVACMEVCTDGAAPTKGTILYLFGGGFMVGSPFEDLPITAALAVKTGARIVAPYYRLAPEHPFPAALDDAFAVAQALSGEGGFCLAGESAGGNLSLALTHRLRACGLPVPGAIAALSPACDLNDFGDSAVADRDPVLRADEGPNITIAYLAGHDVTDPEASPVFGAFDAAFPPTLITTGTRDMLLSSCVRLARVMREGGAAVDLRVWEGLWHVFEFYPDIPEAELSLTEIADFLRPRL